MPASPESWDRWAWAYDFQVGLESRAIDLMVGMLASGPGDRLLEVGCGTGAFLDRLARSSSPPGEAVGVDSSQRMLASVPELPAGWRVERGDATALDFEAAEFDLIVCAYLLHTLDPVPRRCAIAEARRVLRPGGRLGAITVVEPTRGLAAPLVGPIQGLARERRGAIAGIAPLDPRAELAEAGLRPLRGTYTGRGWPSLCILAAREP